MNALDEHPILVWKAQPPEHRGHVLRELADVARHATVMTGDDFPPDAQALGRVLHGAASAAMDALVHNASERAVVFRPEARQPTVDLLQAIEAMDRPWALVASINSGAFVAWLPAEVGDALSALILALRPVPADIAPARKSDPPMPTCNEDNGADLVCTRPRGHEPPHGFIARDGSLAAPWTDEQAEQRRRERPPWATGGR